MLLYHYTSAKLLEKIVASGKLLPSDANGWGLLWATSAPTIDLTSQYLYETVVARFTLSNSDFEPWEEVRFRFSIKKRKRAEQMSKNVRIVNPSDWWVRRAPLPAARWLRIDVRDQRWRPYGSKTWQKRGKPQLGKMPWMSKADYKARGLDLGFDPRFVDDETYADYYADEAEAYNNELAARHLRQTEEENEDE
jgi:hypothetical protein